MKKNFVLIAFIWLSIFTLSSTCLFTYADVVGGSAEGDVTSIPWSEEDDGVVIIDELETPVGHDEELPFADVKVDDWFYEDLKVVYDHKILTGTSDSTYSPSIPVTRAMMITSIFKFSGEEEFEEDIPFADVEKGTYYYFSVVWGKYHDIVKGLGASYNPNSSITRQDMIVMLFRYDKRFVENINDGDFYNNTPSNALKAYKDMDEVSEYAVEAMNWAVDKDIFQGRKADVLAPKSTLTRAELATVMARYLEIEDKCRINNEE